MLENSLEYVKKKKSWRMSENSLDGVCKKIAWMEYVRK